MVCGVGVFGVCGYGMACVWFGVLPMLCVRLWFVVCVGACWLCWCVVVVLCALVYVVFC